ncbi:MAG: DUF5670 family protein [Saprospiraceae bacterium]
MNLFLYILASVLLVLWTTVNLKSSIDGYIYILLIVVLMTLLIRFVTGKINYKLSKL